MTSHAMNLSSEDPEENLTVFQKVVHSSAATTIGLPSRKHQDWFVENDEEIKVLLEDQRTNGPVNAHLTFFQL